MCLSYFYTSSYENRDESFSRLTSSNIQIVIDLLVPLPILCENKYKPFKLILMKSYSFKMLKQRLPFTNNYENEITHRSMLSDKKRELDRSYHFDAKMIKPMRVKSYEDISNQYIEASMKELRKHPLYHTLRLSCDA